MATPPDRAVRALLLLTLGATAPAQSVVRSFDGALAGQRFGGAIDFAGDANGDGVDELVVGMSLDARNGAQAGAVALLSGRHGEPLVEMLGAAGDRLGSAVAGLGDVDGDGRADFAVAAPYDDRGGRDAGAVVVVSGASGVLLWTAFGHAPFEQLGLALANAGDLDGDGREDLAAGAPLATGAAELAGLVRAYSGASGALLHSWAGVQAGENLGSSLAAAGDLDRDGRGDLAMGGIERLRFGAGLVRIVSGASGVELRTLRGIGGDEFGHALALGPDWNQDGWPELVVGAPARNVSSALSSAGAVLVISGRDGSTLATIDGRARFQRLGHALSIPADLDGDGAPDLALGSLNGSVELWSLVGPTRLFAQSGAGRHGSVLGDGGDVDGDGAHDLLVAAPLAGAAQAGRVEVLAFTPRSFVGRPSSVPIAAGARQDWQIDAGPANAGRFYLVLGSLSGIAPGTPLGAVTLPLNLDPYSVASIGGLNLPPFVQSFGVLDAGGRASAAFVVSPALFTGLAGLTLDHAFVLLPSGGGIDFASNPAPMRLRQ
ncbi:MAG: FG-GAP repeat protein [Planctomycetes bacterium]|nr:FG-GAP repeat protein [Planctomycetota bacterium]